MAFCAQCGAEAAGSFCPKCGAAVGTAGSAPGGYAAASATVAPAASAGMSENVASALCYILGLLTGIIFLVLAPYNQNRTIRFHAFQSIFFHVGAIILWVVYLIISGVLAAVTHMLSSLILFPLSLLICLGLFCTWIYLLYAAYSGKKVVLPIVGPLAEKQA
ncbi:MAG TPA: hypothetical protein VN633_00225 [Bryobacteraceae bacterium]|nr:hypothetical protein [Bryobacteraceae bacterium]